MQTFQSLHYCHSPYYFQTVRVARLINLPACTCTCPSAFSSQSLSSLGSPSVPEDCWSFPRVYHEQRFPSQSTTSETLLSYPALWQTDGMKYERSNVTHDKINIVREDWPIIFIEIYRYQTVPKRSVPKYIGVLTIFITELINYFNKSNTY